MKKNIFLLLLALGISIFVNAQKNRYSRVLVFAQKTDLAALASLGLSLEGYEQQGGMVMELSAHELSLLSKHGYSYQMLIEDVSDYYVKQNENYKLSGKSNYCGDLPYITPARFSLGSMGGFYTYSEMLQELDTMWTYYPQFITQKQVVDTFNTNEGRPVYWLRISNNPNIEQSKPKMLYTALTHAREPASMQQMIFYMYFLLENYNIHPDVTNLINNYELYFIPCLNPDGYIYNEITDPMGGGMWRKNRRANLGGTFGVDLNRNFGYMWGFDNQGSSPDPSVDTYRGTHAFSEPESRLLKSMCQKFTFPIVINGHSYSNLLIYPFNYTENLNTPDSLTFMKHSEILTGENRYTTGTGFSILGYLANGDCIDWMYGDQTTKPKILAYTSEIGSPAYGFWPPMSEIENLCRDNMKQNIYAAYLTGKFALLTDLSSNIIGVHQGYFVYNIQNVGIDSIANFTVSVIPLSNNFQSVGVPKIYNNLSHLETKLDSIAFSLDYSISSADTVKFLLAVDNGIFTKHDTVVKIFGHMQTLFSDMCVNLNNWATTSWGVSNNQYYSAPSSITDSPNGSYQGNSFTSISSQQNIDLSGALFAELSFKTKYNVAAGYDYVQLSVTHDNGSTWIPLCGKYTVISGNPMIEGLSSYEGKQLNWVQEQIDLGAFLGQQLKFKFELVSDWYPWTKPDGFYFDDFFVRIIDTTVISASYEMSQLPENVEVFPNPCTDNLNVKIGFKQEIPFQIKIYNTIGQLVYQHHTINKMDIVHITMWPEGMYYVSIETQKGIYYKKFLKLRP